MDAAHFDEVQTNTVVRKRLAKLMAKNCFRDTALENLHSRISDQEMKVLMIDVVDHCYDFLMELCSPHGDAIIDDLKRRDAEVLIERPDGSRITVLVNIRPLKNQREELTGAINCFVDITERKQTEVRNALLARELQHRTKNLLSVIQSIAERSMASGRNIDDSRTALIARLHALAHATDLLSDADFQGACINDVVERALETFAGRFSIEGEHVLLNPGATQGLALVIHELCTNATKYGAYSTPGGRVAIRWSIEEAGDEPKLTFQWQERGGPRVVPPKLTSFGTTLLQLAIGGAAPPDIDYAPDGFTYTFEAPLATVTAISN